MCDKFGAAIAPDMLGDAVGRHRLPKRGQDLLGSDLPLNKDNDTLAGVLIQHRQHFQWTALVGPVKDKIPRPDMVTMDRLSGQAGRNALSWYPLGFGAGF